MGGSRRAFDDKVTEKPSPKFRQPLIQRSPKACAIFMGVSIVYSLGAYARFCTLVIQDITNFLGIACFTVRKRDPVTGDWITSQELDSKRA